MFGTCSSSSSTKQWYSYYRSSIADKMSDYEDIWDKTEMTQRCLSPAESEIQFKAYLASKLSQDVPSSQCSSSEDSDEDEVMPKSSSSTGLSSLESSTENLSSLSISDESVVSEVIYNDPLDALEKATDTRIYNSPEFGQIEEESIYEDLEVNKKPTAETSPQVKRTKTSSQVVPIFRVSDIKPLQRRSVSYTQHSAKSASSAEKRLSAVICKYMTRTPEPKDNKKGAWQMDSSSWEFLNQAGTADENCKQTADSADENGKQTADSAEENCKQTDSGLDSTLSFTNKSADSNSMYESELGTLDPGPLDQLGKSRERIRDYVINQLTSDKWMFGKMVHQFIECTQKLSSQQIESTLRNIRQFMNGMKNYLIRQGEGELHLVLSEERAKVK